MAQEVINIGTVPNDDTGESLRSALNKTNLNFTEVYSDVADRILLTEKGAAEGVAELDVGGTVPLDQLPDLTPTISEAEDEIEHLALDDMRRGDYVIRTDLNKTFIHNGGIAGTMDDYQELVSPVEAGDVTASGLTMATARILGRTTASTGAIEELDATAATAFMNTFTDTLDGLVPAPTAETGKVLLDDGTWALPTWDAMDNVETLSLGDANKILVVNGTGDGIEFGVLRTAVAEKLVTLRAASGADYPLVLADADRHVRMTDASANTVTVPLNATVPFPIGTRLTVIQAGAGTTTINPETVGVTLNSVGLAFAAQWGVATLIKVGTDEWDVFGHLI